MLRDHEHPAPTREHPQQTKIVLIRDSTNPIVYRAEVLKQAGFFVRAITQSRLSDLYKRQCHFQCRCNVSFPEA